MPCAILILPSRLPNRPPNHPRPPHISQWLTSLKVDHGKAFGALRALKQLLFAEPLAVLEQHTAQVDAVSPVHLGHLLLVSGGSDHLGLPHDLFHWTHAAYSEWLDDHSEAEALGLLERCVHQYREGVDGKGGHEYAPISVVVERLLARARARAASRSGGRA